ncbi:MAG TPA: outer membrane beta-barrel protein [Flavobacteriales bacterium]|nr:outer membrane beta-barrel protein [Flavobacteriales bacterium]
MAVHSSGKILVPILLLVHAIDSNAQVDLGVKVGANYNVWSPIEFNWYQIGTYPAATYSGTGYHVGGLLRAPISDNLAFHCELLYSARDVRHDMDATIDYFDGFVDHTQRVHGSDEFRLRYLDLPLLLSLRSGRHLNLQLGPVIGFGLNFQRKGSFTVEETFSGSTDTEIIAYDLSEPVISENVDMGIAVGLGYEWDGGFQLGLRYMRGLTTTGIPDTPVYSSDQGDGIHQNVFQFSAGYWLTKVEQHSGLE